MSVQWKFPKTETVKISITIGNKTVNPLVLAPLHAKKYSYDQYYNAHNKNIYFKNLLSSFLCFQVLHIKNIYH